MSRRTRFLRTPTSCWLGREHVQTHRRDFRRRRPLSSHQLVEIGAEKSLRAAALVVGKGKGKGKSGRTGDVAADTALCMPMEEAERLAASNQVCRGPCGPFCH